MEPYTITIVGPPQVIIFIKSPIILYLSRWGVILGKSKLSKNKKKEIMKNKEKKYYNLKRQLYK